MDGHGARLLKAGSERQALQRGQRLPIDGGYDLQPREVEVGQDSHVLQGERVVDLHKRAARQGGELGDIGGGQAARYSLDAVERNLVCGAGRNGDAAGEGRAAGERRSVTCILDGFGGGTALSCPFCQALSVVLSS